MPATPIQITGLTDIRPRWGYIVNLIAALLAFNAALALVFVPDLFDLPLTRTVNSLAGKHAALDRVVLSLYANEFFSGVIFVSLIWGAWFSTSDSTMRTRIAVGTVASWVAGVASRMLQYTLPTHPRPFYDPRLDFRTPYFSDSAPLNTWDSFPSDHVTVFAGLVTVVYLARFPFRWLAIVWAIAIEGTRTYMGAHYPTDLLGGAALGAVFVWASQAPAALRIGQRLVRYERSRPALFYPLAFILSYEISTLFVALRTFVADMLSLRHVL